MNEINVIALSGHKKPSNPRNKIPVLFTETLRKIKKQSKCYPHKNNCTVSLR